MTDIVLNLIDKLSVKTATKDRFNETYQLMLFTDDKHQCAMFRNELQGMLNSLDTEGIINFSEFDGLGKAFGLVWKNRNKAFHLTKRAIEKAQNIEEA